MVRKMKFRLSDDFIEGLRHYTDAEGDSKMGTCEFVSNYWVKNEKAIIENGKDYKWFVESSAASVGLRPRSMYGRMRVGLNVVQRGLHKGENANLTHAHWACLLLNTTKKDGLIPVEVIEERLEWLNKETDKFGGQVPSTRDIADHFRKNGERTEQDILWGGIVSRAKKLDKFELSRERRRAVQVILYEANESDCKEE